jgi:hypothetical protein
MMVGQEKARRHEREAGMRLVFVGIDPESKTEDCPAAWIDSEALNFVLQGWKADETTKAATRLRSPLPDTEDVIVIPGRMLPILKAACEEMDRALANRAEGAR